MGKAANLAVVGAIADQHIGFRDRLMNSDFRVNQYNNGASISVGSPAFVLDRWRCQVAGFGTAQRGASGLFDAPYKIRLQGVPGSTVATISQSIESANCLDLPGSQVTVSFYAASSTITSVDVQLAYMNTPDDSSVVTTIQTPTLPITSTLTKYVFTFDPLPFEASNGLLLKFIAGPNLGTGWFDFAAPQFEEGSAATPLEFRDYGRQLEMCQRYYVTLGNIPPSTWPFTKLGFGVSTGAANFPIICPLPVTMRAVPTVSWSGVNSSVGSTATPVTNIVVDAATASGVQVTVTGAIYSLGQAVYLQGGTLTFSAEP